MPQKLTKRADERTVFRVDFGRVLRAMSDPPPKIKSAGFTIDRVGPKVRASVKQNVVVLDTVGGQARNEYRLDVHVKLDGQRATLSRAFWLNVIPAPAVDDPGDLPVEVHTP